MKFFKKIYFQNFGLNWFCQCTAEYPTAAEILENSTYVDDVGFSVEDGSEANKITDKIDEILRHGMFSVKCWNSNAPEVDHNLDEDTVCVLGYISGITKMIR